MIGVRLTKSFRVHGCDDLDSHTDSVMDALLALETETLVDSDVSACLADETVEISIMAIGEDFDTLLAIADSAVRSAIHAAGGSTPAWEAVNVNADQELIAA